MERIAQGLLHAAVVYEPHLHHGIVVEPLFEEKLVLVTREPRERVRWHPRYVLVQWTAEFRAQHDAIMPVDITPPVVFADGVFALDFILKSGGSGYFPLRMIIDHLRRGQLFHVPATRVMNCNAHRPIVSLCLASRGSSKLVPSSWLCARRSAHWFVTTSTTAPLSNGQGYEANQRPMPS